MGIAQQEANQLYPDEPFSSYCMIVDDKSDDRDIYVAGRTATRARSRWRLVPSPYSRNKPISPKARIIRRKMFGMLGCTCRKSIR